MGLKNEKYIRLMNQISTKGESSLEGKKLKIRL